MERFTYTAGIASLLLLAVCMPWWNNGMSIATFALSGVWILQRILLIVKGQSLKTAFHSGIPRGIMAWIAFIFVLPVCGLAFTENWNYALWDLRVKLPLLILPLALSGLPTYSSAIWKRVMIFFVTSCTLAALFSLSIYSGWYNLLALPVGFSPKYYTDVRDISPFISHIRLSLFLVIALLVIWFIPIRPVYLQWICRSVTTLIVIVFLFVIQSITGTGVLILCLLLLTAKRIYEHHNRKHALVVLGATTLISALGILYFLREYNKYFTIKEKHTESLPLYTSRGNVYTHVFNNLQLENGYYIWRYIAWDELDSVWTLRSELPFAGVDSKGNPLRGTICRYLTSKGARKDADGLSGLTDAEIRLIEKGTTSVVDLSNNPMRQRLQQLFFEWDAFRNGNDPSGHSVAQRWHYWKAGWNIWKQQLYTGVGTGDVKDAFDNYYISVHSPLILSQRHRAHNQWLTMLLTYGLFGGSLFLFIWWKLLRVSLSQDYLLFLVALTCATSFITEDTLETQAGVTLVAGLLPLIAMWRRPVRLE